MSLSLAMEAMERGSCLELYYGANCLVVDPQVVGYDHQGRLLLLGIERTSEHLAPLAKWLHLRLDSARIVNVCGYMSEGLRPGWDSSVEQFASIEATSH
jgi:hypothetical protein